MKDLKIWGFKSGLNLITLISIENDFELRFMLCSLMCAADYGSFLAAANVIFVDSPVGVGFSYSTVASDYSNFTDSQIGTSTTQKPHTTCLGWAFLACSSSAPSSSQLSLSLDQCHWSTDP
jgi:hypothetical protein